MKSVYLLELYIFVFYLKYYKLLASMYYIT